jgi:hypothetical protein
MDRPRRGRTSLTRGQRWRIAMVSFKVRPRRGIHPNLARPGTGFVSSVRLDRSQVVNKMGTRLRTNTGSGRRGAARAARIRYGYGL